MQRSIGFKKNSAEVYFQEAVLPDFEDTTEENGHPERGLSLIEVQINIQINMYCTCILILWC